jgi:hypothetical protein
MHKIERAFPKELEYAEKLVCLMDDQFKIPLVNFRFGIDPVIGLIPWAGDLISFVISSLIISAFLRNGVPFSVILRMIANIVLDLVVGGIPLLGSVWDFFFKANRKNLKLAREYFEGTQ